MLTVVQLGQEQHANRASLLDEIARSTSSAVNRKRSSDGTGVHGIENTDGGSLTAITTALPLDCDLPATSHRAGLLKGCS